MKPPSDIKWTCITWHPLDFAATHGIAMRVCERSGASKKKDWRWKQHSSFFLKVLGCGMWRDSATNTTAYSRDSTSKFNFIQGALPSKHLCLVHPIRTALQQNQGNKLQDYSDYPQMCTDGKFCSLPLRYIIRLLAPTGALIVMLC